jgi:hypothetical protein
LDILYSGTGLKHFLDILIKITLSGASVVLLDEPELGLHPDLQRQFISYLKNLSLAKNLQIFMATHSQVILNYPDELKFYRVLNSGGTRTTEPVDPQAIHTILSDLGIRPSDIFNQDMCLLVEGASEVIYFEHVVRELYKDEFQKVSVGIIQYGGGSADGIIKGTIDVSNIIPTQKYIYWLRDRDARPVDPPSTSSTQFHAALTGLGFECHIFLNREIEYYYTEAVHVAAQDGIAASIAATQAIYNGDQSQKYRHATAAIPNVNTPQGLQLKSLLKQHLTDRAQLPAEIRQVIEGKLMSWRDEILG